MPSHWNLIFKRLRNFYSKGKSHTYKPWMRLNPSSIRRKFWRSGTAKVKWGHSSLWQICCLVPQKELHCLVQCSSSETVLIYKIHELLPIRSDHLCTKMSFQEAGEHCLRYCCLEKMSPSPPHTPVPYRGPLLLLSHSGNQVIHENLRSCNECIQQKGDSWCVPLVLSMNPNTRQIQRLWLAVASLFISHLCTHRAKPRWKNWRESVDAQNL